MADEGLATQQPEHMGRDQAKILAWRIERLTKAGWSEKCAQWIAELNHHDLLAYGWAPDVAEREYVVFWRLAEKVIACGSETQALYLLSLRETP